MQDVISQLAETQHIKFYFWRRKKERNRNFRCAVKLKRQCYQRGWKMKLQQELALISNLDVMVSMDSGNAHIALCWGKVITLWCYASLCRFSPFHQPLENTLVSDGKISHATHLRLWK
jgi:ADP-heptose:LPS heptosyltransferase